MQSLSDTADNGWTCDQCGTFVPWEMVHCCPGVNVSETPHPSPSLADQTDRLIDAIERLIAALEKAGQR